MKRYLIALLAICLIRVDVQITPSIVAGETWCRSSDISSPCRWPLRKTVITLRTDLFREEKIPYAAAAMLFAGKAQPPVRRRFVGINVESHEWPEESKIWPHLGLLYVGTVAKEADYEVKLWDELIQGKTPLESIVKEGDIVGLSLVTTGIERGVELARRCKALGARYVVAGNDSAAFRARQLLSLPNAPIDAVFTSNSIRSLRRFFREIPRVEMSQLSIPHVAVDAGVAPVLTNEPGGVELWTKSGEFGRDDFFLIPDLSLYGDEYWNLVWSAYRSQFGHKHPGGDRENVRNAVALLAQGCGRAATGTVCDECTILHVMNVVFPRLSYIERTLEVYRKFGINTFFNVTDSAYEMTTLIRQLQAAGNVDSLVMYGRAEAIASNPKRLGEWLGVVNDRLLINCGMESADERILQSGIKKSDKTGSRVDENHAAVRYIRDAGEKAHLHYSLIFGSVGEDADSCKRNLDFVAWVIATLKRGQLDVCESDIFWLNFGAPSAVVLHDYPEASKRAQLAGKTISVRQWKRNFARFANELIVPQSCEENWYHFFTNISFEDALEYNAQVRKMMETVPDAVTGRNFAFRPPA
ncbi:MAG: hypothetical protein WC050_04375 [Candidatus Paceibacterota bacterium]